LLKTDAAQQMQQQRLQAIQHQRQQAMMAQSMGQMQPGMYPMQPNGYVHPQQLAQFQAMQSRVMAQRPQQVSGLSRVPSVVVNADTTQNRLHNNSNSR